MERRAAELITHLLVVPVTFLPELRAEQTTATLFLLKLALYECS